MSYEEYHDLRKSLMVEAQPYIDAGIRHVVGRYGCNKCGSAFVEIEGFSTKTGLRVFTICRECKNVREF